MIPPSTYFEFHLVCTLPLIATLGVLAWRRGDTLAGPAPLAGFGITVALAIVYTTPWGSQLIDRGVWWYGEGVVWGSLWSIPAGEYLFFVLQPILTVLFLCQLSVPTDTDLALSKWERALGAITGLGVGGIGASFLFAGQSTVYLGAILLWAGPIFAIQWAFGWTQLWRARRTVAVAILVPTLYLWIADWAAISLGLWVISDTYTVGIAPLGLPIEEALFFLVTNVFIVQSVVLYLWLIEQWPTIADSPQLARVRRLAWFRESDNQYPGE